MLKRAANIARMLTASARRWWDDDPFTLAAALAFYAMLSLAPSLTIAVAVSGAVFGDEAAVARLAHAVERTAGPEAAGVVHAVVGSAARSRGGGLAAILGFATFALGSTAVFGQLRSALNRVWDVRPQRRNGAVRGLVRRRLVSFALVVGVGVMLLLSLAASTLLNALHVLVPEALATPSLWQAAQLATSFGLLVLLVAALYEILPDAEIAWSDAAVGAAVTAALCALGQLGIGIYLGRASVVSSYGAAGSVVALLVWLYYSALVFLYGAEVTQVWAARHGSGIRPSPNAVRIGRKRDPVAELANGSG